jgi:hypothetical protein
MMTGTERKKTTGILFFLCCVFYLLPGFLAAQERDYSVFSGIIPHDKTIVGVTPWNADVIAAIERTNISSDDDPKLRWGSYLILENPVEFEDQMSLKERLKIGLISNQFSFVKEIYDTANREAAGIDRVRFEETAMQTITVLTNRSFQTNLTVYLSLKGSDGVPYYGLYMAGSVDRLPREEIDRIAKPAMPYTKPHPNQPSEGPNIAIAPKTSTERLAEIKQIFEEIDALSDRNEARMEERLNKILSGN